MAHMGLLDQLGPEAAEKEETKKEMLDTLMEVPKKKPAAKPSTVKAKTKLQGGKPSKPMKQTTKPTKKTDKAKGMKTAAKRMMSTS